MKNIKKYNIYQEFFKKRYTIIYYSPLTYFINDLISYSDYLTNPWNNNFPYYFSQYFGYLVVNVIIFIYYKLKNLKTYISFKINTNKDSKLNNDNSINDSDFNFSIFADDLNIKTKKSSIFFCIFIIIFDNFPLCFIKYLTRTGHLVPIPIKRAFVAVLWHSYAFNQYTHFSIPLLLSGR